MSDDKKTDSLQPEEIRSTGSPPLSANHESRTDEADSSVAVEFRGVCDISPDATFCCLALAQWQR